ncbi:hypothetical protein DSO57_1010484 [Entomophthora muscae]|uniref:Uncharacterized protein n=1 Tax=Entomophthora muscae TaxID=34485 RepID=A0ACC2SJA5_9FUNG|nr:hypothetical protein DSO57_1010484 [Entomophthora muscae]
MLEPAKGDITNADDMLRVCQGASVVINLVGIMHETKPNYTFDSVQHIGAKNVAKAAQHNNAQLVHISAIGADASSDIPYNKSKGLGELAARDSSPDAIILRPSLVFGPEDDFFNRFAKLAGFLPFMPVFGGGYTKFQPVYVWDVARAALLSVTGKHKGKTFELGGPAVYSYREMMQLMLSQAGIRRPIISVPWAVGMIQGFFLEKLPLNLFTITRDQVRLLHYDNVVGPSSLGLGDLGIPGTAAEKILHTYLRKKDLTTPNKRTHRMQSQDISQELDSIRSLKTFAGPRPNAPNLEKQLEYHMEPPSRSNK